MHDIAAAPNEPDRPVHTVGFVVGSGPGYVRDLNSLEMTTDPLAARRFPTLLGAEQVASRLTSRGLAVHVTRLVKNGLGLEIPRPVLEPGFDSPPVPHERLPTAPAPAERWPRSARMLVHLQVVVAVIVVVGLVVAPADKPHVAPWFVLGATLSYLGVCAAHAIADCRERRSAP